jgi:hypothetical protein
VKTVSSDDSPGSWAPLTYDRGVGVQLGDDVVDTIGFVEDFRLYVTASTADPWRIGPDAYTSRAWARWRFNGSGTVDQTSPYTWHGSPEAGVTVVLPWTPITDGSQPPQLSGELANHANGRETYN